MILEGWDWRQGGVRWFELHRGTSKGCLLSEIESGALPDQPIGRRMMPFVLQTTAEPTQHTVYR